MGRTKNTDNRILTRLLILILAGILMVISPGCSLIDRGSDEDAAGETEEQSEASGGSSGDIGEVIDELELNGDFDYARVFEMGGPEDIPLDAEAYHHLWDDLVDEGYVTRELLGYPSDGDERYPVYKYSIKLNPDHVNSHYKVQSGELYKRPRILITSGFHGAEKATPVMLRNLVDDLIHDPEYASTGVRYEWDIIPLVNPWGYSHSALQGGTLTNGFIHDSLSNYTIVENGEYNQGVRLNADGLDPNRDWHDGSGGFPSEEARLVRDVLKGGDYDLVLDMHQTKNTTACGFISVGLRPDSMDEAEYEERCAKAYTAVSQAGIVTDRLISDHLGIDTLEQTTYPWDGTSESTFRNYASGYTAGGQREIDLDNLPDYSLCLEISIYCSDYSGSEAGTSFNKAANTYGNTFVHYFARRLEDLL